jgi:hypothetical protein
MWLSEGGILDTILDAIGTAYTDIEIIHYDKPSNDKARNYIQVLLENEILKSSSSNPITITSKFNKSFFPKQLEISNPHILIDFANLINYSRSGEVSNDSYQGYENSFLQKFNYIYFGFYDVLNSEWDKVKRILGNRKLFDISRDNEVIIHPNFIDRDNAVARGPPPTLPPSPAADPQNKDAISINVEYANSKKSKSNGRLINKYYDDNEVIIHPNFIDRDNAVARGPPPPTLPPSTADDPQNKDAISINVEYANMLRAAGL